MQALSEEIRSIERAKMNAVMVGHRARAKTGLEEMKTRVTFLRTIYIIPENTSEPIHSASK